MSTYPVYPPIVTPFSRSNAVDTDALASLVGSVEQRGVDGVVPCGTTGEFASLDDEEYETVVETVADAASGTVIAGVCDTSVTGVRSKVDVAADSGCDGVLLTGPYFHQANAAGGTEAFIREAVGDTDLSVYLYNIPQYVGEGLDAELVGQLAQDGVVQGLKDTSGDFDYLLKLARETPGEFDLLCGYDSLLVPALVTGASGGINALSNVVPEVFDATTTALEKDDVDRAVELSQTAIAPLFEQCATYGFAPATKVGVAARGFVDSTAVRPPLVELAPEAVDAISTAVDESLATL